MRILILGNGGREHALGYAFQDNPKCDALFFAPGNGGTSALGTNVTIDPSDPQAVLALIDDEAIDFTVIGPEAPLVAGVADALRENGHLVLGPSKAAAALEGSKAFTKAICDACGAPTAAYAAFDEFSAARAYLDGQSYPLVIKADGLAAGKGVTIAEDEAMAVAALQDIFDGKMGDARVVIEAFLHGEEASLFVLCDANSAKVIGTAQDHKRAYDGDKGPNTGGMGAYSPAPVLSADVEERAMKEIVEPVLAEMRKQGTPFEGILYTGLMIDDGAPSLVEFNVRFGDPECQVIALRLGGQMFDLFHAAAENRLAAQPVNFANDHALTVVYAANGYPGAVEKGSEIKELNNVPNDSAHYVFHAGTVQDGDALKASGGRVLSVTARGETLQEARDEAYKMVDAIDWPEGFYRKDIGWRAL